MSVLRRIYPPIVIAVGILGVVAAAAQIEPLIGVLLVLFPLEALGVVLSVIYMAIVHRRAGGRSWVFRMLIIASEAKAVAGIYGGLLAFLAISQLVVLPRNVTAPFSIVLFEVIMAPPIYYALVIWDRRRKTGRPLPLQEDD